MRCQTRWKNVKTFEQYFLYIFWMLNYVFIVIESIENIIRQTAEQINDKPRFQIIHSYDFRITDYLTARSHERCVKVQNCRQKEKKNTDQFRFGCDYSESRNFCRNLDAKAYSPISMKKITSTIESTTNNETSSEVLFLKATLYGTCSKWKRNGTEKNEMQWMNTVLGAEPRKWLLSFNAIGLMLVAWPPAQEQISNGNGIRKLTMRWCRGTGPATHTNAPNYEASVRVLLCVHELNSLCMCTYTVHTRNGIILIVLYAAFAPNGEFIIQKCIGIRESD